MCFFFQVREEIDKYGIKIYQFPHCDSDEDEEFKQQDKELKVSRIHIEYVQNSIFNFLLYGFLFSDDSCN